MPTNLRPAAFALPVLLLAGGCFTREEHIVIRPDGSADVRYTVEAPTGDAAAGDARPAEPGWKLVQTEVKKDGTRRVWEKTVADLNDLPATLGTPDDPRAGTFLMRHTRLEIERGEGRTIYRFERRYRGRDLALLKTLRQALVTSELAARAEQAGAASLTPVEREELFSGLASYEQIATWTRWRNALGRAVVAGELDVDVFARAMTALEARVEERVDAGYLQGFFAMGEDEQDRALASLRAELRAVIEGELPADARGPARARIDEEERRLAVTESIAGETFGLTVEMPGVVVTTNGLAGTEEVSWQFSGEDLLGADVVARAVSVLVSEPEIRESR